MGNGMGIINKVVKGEKRMNEKSTEQTAPDAPKL